MRVLSMGRRMLLSNYNDSNEIVHARVRVRARVLCTVAPVKIYVSFRTRANDTLEKKKIIICRHLRHGITYNIEQCDIKFNNGCNRHDNLLQEE